MDRGSRRNQGAKRKRPRRAGLGPELDRASAAPIRARARIASGCLSTRLRQSPAGILGCDLQCPHIPADGASGKPAPASDILPRLRSDDPIGELAVLSVSPREGRYRHELFAGQAKQPFDDDELEELAEDQCADAEGNVADTDQIERNRLYRLQ